MECLGHPYLYSLPTLWYCICWCLFYVNLLTLWSVENTILRECALLTANTSFAIESSISLVSVSMSSLYTLPMVRPYPQLMAFGQNWALIIHGNHLACRFSSVPSELQPHCLVIQATEVLEWLQSAGVFGDRREWKVANSFAMGVVTKTVMLARLALSTE